MNIFKRLFGVIVLLIGAVFGYGFLNGLMPFESVNWVSEVVLLIITILFFKVGWGLLKAENAVTSRKE
jgi:hypothetical protein